MPVKKGDTIIKKIPPTVGESGKTVLDKEVEGIKGNEYILEEFCGTNTEVKDDSLVASEEGIVTFVDNRYVVEKEYIIKTNIGLETGSIDISKDLDVQIIVEGDVNDEYKVSG